MIEKNHIFKAVNFSESLHLCIVPEFNHFICMPVNLFTGVKLPL